MNDVANHASGIPGSELPQPDRAPAGTAETRAAIQRLANDLRAIESRMAKLCATLPEQGEDFDPLAEMGGTLHCVNNDLIADAIKTLQLAATRGDADLRRDFDLRQQLLANPRRIGWELLAFQPLPLFGRTTPEPERRQHDETGTDPSVVPRAPRRRRGDHHRPPAPPAPPPGTNRDPGQAVTPNAEDDH
jgi:hypothetical protein